MTSRDSPRSRRTSVASRMVRTQLARAPSVLRDAPCCHRPLDTSWLVTRSLQRRAVGVSSCKGPRRNRTQEVVGSSPTSSISSRRHRRKSRSIRLLAALITESAFPGRHGHRLRGAEPGRSVTRARHAPDPVASRAGGYGRTACYDNSKQLVTLGYLDDMTVHTSMCSAGSWGERRGG